MPNENRPAKSRSYYSLIFLAAGLYVFIREFAQLRPILLAFILTLLLTLALNPVILKLRRLTGGRTFATALVVLVFLCIVGLSGWAFYHPIQRSAAQFIKRLPEYWERVQRPILKMEQQAVNSEARIKREVTKEVAAESDSSRTNASSAPPSPQKGSSPQPAQAPSSGGIIQSGASAALGGVSGSFKGIAANATSVALIIVTAFFSVIFTLLKPRPVMRMIFGMIPEPHHPKAMTITKRIVEFVPRWALATLTGMAIIGLMIFLAMWPLVGFQDALVLGLIALVFEAVPYIGPILASIPALLLAAGEGGWMPLWVLLAYITVQALENNFIMPVVVGGQLQLHPVAVIFSMLLCVTIFGVLGVLIAMPVVAVIMILHEEIYRPRFLPDVSDSDLDEIAQTTLEKKKISSSKTAPKEKSTERKT